MFVAVVCYFLSAQTNKQTNKQKVKLKAMNCVKLHKMCNGQPGKNERGQATKGLKEKKELGKIIITRRLCLSNFADSANRLTRSPANWIGGKNMVSHQAVCL